MSEQVGTPELSVDDEVHIAIQSFADALLNQVPDENQTKPYIMAELACRIDREQNKWHGPEYGNPHILAVRLEELGVSQDVWSRLSIPNDDIIWGSVHAAGQYNPNKIDLLHCLLVDDPRITLTKPELVSFGRPLSRGSA